MFIKGLKIWSFFFSQILPLQICVKRKKQRSLSCFWRRYEKLRWRTYTTNFCYTYRADCTYGWKMFTWSYPIPSWAWSQDIHTVRYWTLIWIRLSNIGLTGIFTLLYRITTRRYPIVLRKNVARSTKTIRRKEANYHVFGIPECPWDMLMNIVLSNVAKP